MKKFILLLFVAFTFSEVHSANLKFTGEDQLSSLLDSFSVAMVKKNKAWIGTNLTDSCVMYDPTGATLNKAAIIKIFTGGVYNISKSAVNNKVFKLEGMDASGSAIFNVEGTANINGGSSDLSGGYKLSVKFKKTDKGWKISGISVT